MHTTRDFPVGEIRLELHREQPFAADGAQRHVETPVAGRLVCLELRRQTACLEQLLHLTRLPQRELRRPRRDDQRTRHAASTKPSIVERAASTRTSSPRARAALLVIGPIVAAGARRAASSPTASTNPLTDDADVNVTRSTSPASSCARNDSAPSPSATERYNTIWSTTAPSSPSPSYSVSRAPSAAAYSTRAPRTSRRSLSASSSASATKRSGEISTARPQSSN